MQVTTLLRLSVATAVATIALKAGAWWLTGSVGLLSDALESLVNLASALFALAMVTIAARPADAAEEDFRRRAAGGVPDEIPAVALAGAPLAIGALLKQAGLAPSTSEALRLVEQGGVRVDGDTVGDKALKLGPGTFVVQVGKRKFARVTLSA